MKTKETYQERYARAKARVDDIRGFYHHLMIYVIINIGIAAFNYYQNQWSTPWFLYTLVGWGIGVVAHAFGTFGRNPFTNKDWEEKKIKEIMEKDQL